MQGSNFTVFTWVIYMQTLVVQLREQRGVQHDVLLSSFLYLVNKHMESEVCQQNK